MPFVDSTAAANDSFFVRSVDAARQHERIALNARRSDSPHAVFKHSFYHRSCRHERFQAFAQLIKVTSSETSLPDTELHRLRSQY